MSDYAFDARWRLPCAPDVAYAALADITGYPSWWPQFVAAERLDDDTVELRCRSVLPHDLVLVAHREVEDPSARVLRARFEGDLEGFIQWTISANGTGAVALSGGELDIRQRIVRAAGRLAKPALRFNHQLMMRAGEKGLRHFLAR